MWRGFEIRGTQFWKQNDLIMTLSIRKHLKCPTNPSYDTKYIFAINMGTKSFEVLNHPFSVICLSENSRQGIWFILICRDRSFKSITKTPKICFLGKWTENEKQIIKNMQQLTYMIKQIYIENLKTYILKDICDINSMIYDAINNYIST